MKTLAVISLFFLLASCSSAGSLERLETRYGIGASSVDLRAELEEEEFNIVDKTDFKMIQGGFVMRDGQALSVWNIDEYLDFYCDSPNCSYWSAGRKDEYLGWILTRRYFVYWAEKNGKILAIETMSEPWRWLDFK